MSTNVAEIPQPRNGMVAELRSSNELIARAREIEDVVARVLKPGIHYGVIPGTPKPSLYKAGADELAKVFSIAGDYHTEKDLSTNDEVTIRIKCVGTHAPTNTVLGSALGECSSNESKYKWRRPVCKEEFEAFPADRKRLQWKRGKNNSAYSEEQVRTEPADIRNTVLQMAEKRAFVAMIRSVTGVSAIFGQDLEDMPEEIRAALIDARGERDSRSGQQQRVAQQPQAQRQAPASKSNNTPTIVTEGQVKVLLKKMDEAGMSAETLCNKFGIKAITDLKFDDLNAALAFIKDPERDAIQDPPEAGQ
jgi:hypothetical protein